MYIYIYVICAWYKCTFICIGTKIEYSKQP